MNNELDESWIKNFENIEQKFNIFYKEKSKNIEIIYIYIDNNNEIEFIKKEDYNLNNENKILKSNLICVINNNKIMCEKKYKFLNILRYNISINPNEVINLYKNKNSIDFNNFLHTFNTLDDIYFNDTIALFSKLNSLYIIYGSNNNTNQITKKIFFNKKKESKTKRKKYKGF